MEENALNFVALTHEQIAPAVTKRVSVTRPSCTLPFAIWNEAEATQQIAQSLHRTERVHWNAREKMRATGVSNVFY